MNDLVRDLASIAPALGMGIAGNGVGSNGFMEGFTKMNAILDAKERERAAMGQQQTLFAQHQEDRQRAIQRQTTADQYTADERARQLAMQRLGLMPHLAELGATGDTPEDAQRIIETAIPGLMDAFGQETMAYGQPAVEMATHTITARQKRQVSEFIEAALKTSFIADNPDADPEITNLPAHIQQVIGKPSAKLSELQQFAQLPVGKPQGKTRVPAMAGSFEDYVEKKYGPNATADQILEARKVYQQSDDRPITVNTGANDNRINSRIDRIVGSFNTSPIVKEFNEVQAQHQTISQIVNSKWSGPGDMSVVFAFMKALDPNSVVRETEYANAAKSGNIFSGWAARFNGALNPSGGFLSEEVKRDFLRTIEARMGVKRAQYDNLRKQTVQKIDRIKAGAPETGDEAVTDYGAAFPQGSTQQAAAPPKIGTVVRDKKTGALVEVTGVRPDGSLIVKPRQ